MAFAVQITVTEVRIKALMYRLHGLAEERFAIVEGCGEGLDREGRERARKPRKGGVPDGEEDPFCILSWIS